MLGQYAYTPIGEHPRQRRWAAVVVLCSAASAILIFVAAPNLSGRPPLFSAWTARSERPETSTTPPSSLDFELYKIALSSRVGDSRFIREFVNQTIAHVDPNFDLGCGGVKINGYLMPFGPQLHWVESTILSNDPTPIEVWQQYFDDLNDGFAEFNAFMHNKITMFTSNLSQPLAALRHTGIPLMYRRSTGYSGAASPVRELAHVLFPIAGRAYELAAPVTEDILSETRSWPKWNDEANECPRAHRLDQNLDEYVDVYNTYVAEAPEVMAKWADERGYHPPMLALTTVAVTDKDLKLLEDTLFADLSSITGMTVIEELRSSACDVYRVPTVSSKAFRSPVRYVVNYRANEKLAANGDGRSVGDYNSYILSTHEAITASYESWAGWDHWLDQHIGLKYVGADVMGIADELNEDLVSRRLPVGQRTTADYGDERAVHWYTGYAGSMTWEYWVIGCATASINHAADVCACVPSNNDYMFFQEYGYNCTGLGDWYSNSANDGVKRGLEPS
mmetsp:Transcript_15123/g.47507  ORF Transcript_15123/g.47507 Transcript_15123/m.47507 type:complete len:506 (-) Transcript_15123:304-1821(-)